MIRPAFLFYPVDWLGNANLRRCSHAQRGAWVDVMCLMHEQEEYGVLRWPLGEIARAVGAKLPDLRMLVRLAVLKGSDEQLLDPYVYVPRTGRRDGAAVELVAAQPGPLWFSSRMVRDEYVRLVRSGDSPKRPPKPPPNHSPNPTIGETFGEPFGGGIGPRARPARAPSSLSLSSSSSTYAPTGAQVAGVRVSPGEACKAMREAGMADVNPSHPTLVAMLAQGMTLPELADAAKVAVGKGKGFGWALERAIGLRQDAARLQLAPPGQRDQFMAEILAGAPVEDAHDEPDARARG